MKQQDWLYWIWFAEAIGLSGANFRGLLTKYSSPAEIYHLDDAEIERCEELPEKIREALCNRNLQRAAEILDACQQLGIGILPYQSDLYPTPLREMRDPPVLLYYAGKVPDFEKHLSIGMVGSRKMSVYGTETAYKISYELAKKNALIVSGMAAGIDGVCAAGALRAGGFTVAVLGCGLDIVYPKHHGRLLQQIADHGLVLSEFPPGTRPVGYHFPIRNRIISGLSHGVVVVEAGPGSGSLITAKIAVTQGKDVFAIPAYGDGVGNESANGLLRDGALFATGAADILNRYRYVFPSTLATDAETKKQEPISCDYGFLTELGVLERDFVLRMKDMKKQRNRPQALPESEESVSQPPKNEPKARRESSARQNTVKAGDESASVSEAPSHHKTPDDILQSLDPVGLAILQTMPDDRAISADDLGNLGYSSGEIMTALTMLELSGLIQKLPGGLYTKA